MGTTDLDEQTRQLLDDYLSRPGRDRLTIRQLAEKCGVSERWVKMYRAGEIPAPGWPRIRALNDFLTGRRAIRQARPVRQTA